jgi:hypothetical protein
MFLPLAIITFIFAFFADFHPKSMSLAAHPVSLIFVVIILTYINAMIGLR